MGLRFFQIGSFPLCHFDDAYLTYSPILVSTIAESSSIVSRCKVTLRRTSQGTA